MALPMLPGYSFPDPNKQDFKKTQTFGFKNGLVVNSDISKKDLYDTQSYEEPELPPITLLGPATMTRSTRTEVKMDPYVPPDVKYYKQVLQFNGYWKETIGGQQHERGAVIHYFLEDDTIQVIEPKIPNSGIQQGVLLRRQHIPLDNNFANTAPFQTSLNSNSNSNSSSSFSRSSPSMTRSSLPAESNLNHNRGAKGGVRDPNNYLNSTFNNNNNNTNNFNNTSPTITRTLSPSLRSSPTNYNTTIALKSNKDTPSYYTWRDLGVGYKVAFFGREYYIVDADQFTRTFYKKEGIELEDGEDLPVVLTTTKVAPSTRLLSHDLRTTEERFQLKKFLENDRKVLRFYCVWDDKSAGYTERRPFILHYFLVDDNIELREVLSSNSGRDPATTFMKKQRLPKKPTSLSDMKTAEHYTDADLAIGSTISVFGRTFLIYDADAYTRKFYEETYGVTEFPVVHVSEQARAIVTREIPEYTGFGSEEDSLANCLSLVPKPPKKIQKNPNYTSVDVLRFTSVLEGGKKGDEDRRFVISFFLEDNTLSVFENPIRGIKGGKFMERKKLKNTKTGNFYEAFEFFVGALVEINSHKFRLIEGDSYACQFFQDHEDEYEQATLDRVIEDVRAATTTLKPGLLRRVLSSTPFPSPAVFKQGLQKSGLILEERIFSILCQIFDSADNGIDVNSFLRAVGV